MSNPNTNQIYTSEDTGEDYVPTGEVRFPTPGEFYVQTRYNPGNVRQSGEGNTYTTPKVIVVPLFPEDDDSLFEDGTEDVAFTNTTSTPNDLTAEFAEAASDGVVFYDSEGNEFAAIPDAYGEPVTRLPLAGDFYVSNNSQPGVVKGPSSGNGFSTPKLIVTPLDLTGIVDDEDTTEETTTTDSDDGCGDNACKSCNPGVPTGEPSKHQLARFIRNVDYQQSGRSTAAIVTVILPGNGATAILTGLGLSVANPEDRFSRSEGRRIALLRALENIVASAV